MIESVPLKSSVEIVEENRVVQKEESFSESDLSISFDYDDYKTDTGLLMYRQSQSRAAVEWFYTQVTNNREVALAILDCADKYDIPLSLAFSLAHTESNYNPVASHNNVNGTIDRGLFQIGRAHV